jgi:hypothetical protein
MTIPELPTRIAPGTVPGGLAVNIHLARDGRLLDTHKLTDRGGHAAAVEAHLDLARAFRGERVVSCTYDGDTGAFVAMALTPELDA